LDAAPVHLSDTTWLEGITAMARVIPTLFISADGVRVRVGVLDAEGCPGGQDDPPS
jgi:hypothetical protein